MSKYFCIYVKDAKATGDRWIFWKGYSSMSYAKKKAQAFIDNNWKGVKVDVYTSAWHALTGSEPEKTIILN